MRAGMTFFAVFISVFYLIGFSMLGYALWAAHRSTQASNWPTVEGSITKVNLKETQDDGTTYEVQVEYTYVVAGKAYDGSRLAFGYVGSSGREAHAAIFEKLHAAKKIDVRYSPSDPSLSTLSFGIHRSIKLAFAFAITWLAFVFGFTILWWLASQHDSTLLQNLTVR